MSLKTVRKGGEGEINNEDWALFKKCNVIENACVVIDDSFTISPFLNLCVLIPILKIRKGNIFSSFVRVFSDIIEFFH